MKFRKRPVVVEAFQMRIIRTDKSPSRLPYFGTKPWPRWIVDAWNSKPGTPGYMHYVPTEGFWIYTLEGQHKVSDGDWIIQGVKGELYPCKPDIFEATYEAIKEGDR